MEWTSGSRGNFPGPRSDGLGLGKRRARVLAAVLASLLLLAFPAPRARAGQAGGQGGGKGDAVGLHRVEEWPPDKARGFKEAPGLSALVREGKLPPVSERLPENPLVVVPPEQRGPYGGTWTRFCLSVRDIGHYRHRIAYEGLLRWDPLGRKLLPNLAWKWSVGEGGRAYTIHLRQGVRWSDGQPFDADDVLFWYSAVLGNKELTPALPFHFSPGGSMVRVERVDRYTVRFVFQKPNGLFLMHLAGEPGYELVSYPAHYLRRFHPNFTDQGELRKKAQAAGMDFWYQLFKSKATWQNPELPTLWAWSLVKPPPARPAVFERNPYYWKVDPDGNQLPYIDRLTFEILGPEMINLRAVNGEVGMQSRHIFLKNYQLFLANRQKGGYRILSWLDGGVGNLILIPNQNHKDPVLAGIFGDSRFRKALSRAINRNELNEAFYFGLGQPRQMAPPSFSRFYDPDLEKAYLEYDPVLASRLLDGMGLDKKGSDGFRLRPDGSPLIIYLESSTDLQDTQPLELIAEYWREVGLRVKVRITARQLYQARINSLQHHIAAWNGAGAFNPLIDPRYFLPYSRDSLQAIDYARWFRSGGRQGTEPPPEVKETLEIYRQATRTADEEEQVRLFKRILELNREYLWVIGTVGDLPQLFIVKNSMRNVPDRALSSWLVHSPGNTAPECYAVNN